MFLLPAESGNRYHARNTYPDNHIEAAYCWRELDTAGQPARINTVWQLWDATTSNVVAKTEPDIFYGSSGYEDMRVYHF